MLFKIGLVLVVVGCAWMGAVFDDAKKIHDGTQLEFGTMFEIKKEFAGDGIGFYTILMPEFDGQEVFIQVRDPGNNVVDENMIQTRMSVGYFDYHDGAYTVKITGISGDAKVRVELGDTNSRELKVPGILVLVGVMVLIASSYFKLKNYNMAQPDENIS